MTIENTPTFNATLIEGNSYTQMPPFPHKGETIVFKKGIPQKVTKDVKEYLEKTATFDQETKYPDGRIERTPICCFDFVELELDESTSHKGG